MKRLILTLIAVFYLGISSGATVHLHYCMGQLVEWGMAAKNSDECGNCGMKAGTSEDCCKDERKQVKFESEQQIQQNSFQLKAPGTDLAFFPYINPTAIYISSLPAERPVSNAPPETHSTPVFIRNCNFRI